MNSETTNKYICICIVLTTIALMAGIAIPCGIATTRHEQKDEAVKVAVAENGCTYADGVVDCMP